MMDIILHDRNLIKSGYAKTKNQKILEQFRDSKMDCAKVVNWTNKDAKCCANSLNASIKRFGFVGIKATYDSDLEEVYLLRK